MPIGKTCQMFHFFTNLTIILFTFIHLLLLYQNFNSIIIIKNIGRGKKINKPQVIFFKFEIHIPQTHS